MAATVKLDLRAVRPVFQQQLFATRFAMVFCFSLRRYLAGTLNVVPRIQCFITGLFETRAVCESVLEKSRLLCNILNRILSYEFYVIILEIYEDSKGTHGDKFNEHLWPTKKNPFKK